MTDKMNKNPGGPPMDRHGSTGPFDPPKDRQGNSHSAVVSTGASAKPKRTRKAKPKA